MGLQTDKFVIVYKVFHSTLETKTTEVSTPAKSGKTMEIEDDYVPKLLKPSVAIQVYRRAGATRSPIFPSPVTSSPAPHPYFWGNQHRLVPIDGNAICYPASYHTAPKAYPSIAGGATLTNPEAEGMVLKKNSNSVQKFKGSSNHADVVGFRSGENGSLPSVSGFDGASQRAAVGRDTTDDNANKDFSPTRKRTSVQMIEDGIGVNNSSTAQKASPNASNVTLPVASATMVRPQEVKQENCIQHEDELRKERRKQANRESAKRSRLRKQEECNKLQAVAKTLKSDISFLHDELMRLSEKCMEFQHENKSITEELIQKYGLGAISDLDVKYPDFFQQYLDDKRNSNDTETQSTISMREETPSEDLTSPNQNTEH